MRPLARVVLPMVFNFVLLIAIDSLVAEESEDVRISSANGIFHYEV